MPPSRYAAPWPSAHAASARDCSGVVVVTFTTVRPASALGDRVEDLAYRVGVEQAHDDERGGGDGVAYGGGFGGAVGIEAVGAARRTVPHHGGVARGGDGGRESAAHVPEAEYGHGGVVGGGHAFHDRGRGSLAEERTSL